MLFVRLKVIASLSLYLGAKNSKKWKASSVILKSRVSLNHGSLVLFIYLNSIIP